VIARITWAPGRKHLLEAAFFDVLVRRFGLQWVDAVEKGLRTSPNSDFADSEDDLGTEAAMMGRQTGEQASLFYEFRVCHECRS
jgi:hypothetical protein